MGGIRATVEECRFVRRIFENHRLKVDERDIFMEKKFQAELDSRLKMDGAPVPQVFVNGVWLGVSKSCYPQHIHTGTISQASLFLNIKL